VLVELRLRNVAVIESVTLPLAPGFNVLTGETGAGKSLIVGALGLLLGERAAADRIRPGADRAVVEATFDIGRLAALRSWLDAHGIDGDEDTLILRREVSGAGRSRAWVNASSVTVATLRALARQLVTVHGQHEAHTLLDAAAQRHTLDGYADAGSLAGEVAQAHRRLLAAREARDALEVRGREAAQRADYLRFLVDEIDAARIRADEEEALDAEHRRLSHADELRTLAADAVGALQGDRGAVLERLATVRRAVSHLQRIDPALERLQGGVDTAWYALEELARELEAYAETVEVDPARLRDVEARRALLHRLQRAHGPSLAEVLATADRARAELALVDDLEGARALAEREVQAAGEALRSSAHTLTGVRRTAATRLGRAVTALLPELGMPDGRFEVVLVPLDAPGANGAEQVQFTVALNAGAPAGPIDRIASGGELSRVMLAMSTVLAQLQAVPTLVFDEVDAGVGGAVAWQLGALMRRVARHHQVLAISHLAQIAACAHHHVVVHKAASAGYTTADTSAVRDDARVTELARMLGGDADREVSRAHARELLVRGATVLEAEERGDRAPRPAANDAGPSDQPTPPVSAEETRGTRAARGGRARGTAR
jgi:DNA repair protein RecN (Recombination protein N)